MRIVATTAELKAMLRVALDLMEADRKRKVAAQKAAQDARLQEFLIKTRGPGATAESVLQSLRKG